MTDYRLREAERLVALARERLAAERADRPGVAGYAERVRLAQETVDALERQRADREAVFERQRTALPLDAVPQPPAPPPAVDPEALAGARRDVEAASDAAAGVRTDRIAAWDWPDRMQRAGELLRAAQERLARLERQDTEHRRFAERVGFPQTRGPARLATLKTGN